MLKINNMANALVVIPTFNEIENIERIIRTVFSLPKKFDILVVDDNSPDGTSAAVQLLKNEFSGRLFLREKKRKVRVRNSIYPRF